MQTAIRGGDIVLAPGAPGGLLIFQSPDGSRAWYVDMERGRLLPWPPPRPESKLGAEFGGTISIDDDHYR